MTTQMSQLGPVASGWNALPLKWVAQMAAGGTPDSNDSSYWCEHPEGTPWVAIGDMSQVEYVQSTAKSLAPAGLFSRKLPIGEPGTILFAMYASVGEVAVLDIQATWNQALLGITPSSLLDSRFLYYVLAAMKPHLVSEFRSTTQNNLNAEQVGNFKVPVPPRSVQEAIADFLDRETAKIDAVIEKQRALVDGLRRLHASTIEAAVTRGLGFKNRLRADDSNQSDRIPEGWSLIRADRALERVKRAPREDDGVVTAFRDGQVTLRANRRTEGFTEALQEIGYQGIRKGDLVIHAMDAFAGAIGVSDSDGKASPVVHAYRGKLADPHFMAYVLREASRAGFIQSLAKGIRERSTSFDPASLKKVYVFLPGMEEQRGIAAHMARETARIDAIIARSERLIELSQERRSALITAAVTGKIEITTDTKALEGVA